MLLILVINRSHAITIERVCLDKNNDITIIWNVPMDTCDKFVYYRIYGRENESIAFKLIKEIKEYSIVSDVEIGAGVISSQWAYYIEYKYLCGSEVVQISETVVIDKESPKTVQIDSVSVFNEFVSIGWKESESTDTKGYIVYYVDQNDQNIQIGYLNGRKNTFFIDSLTGDATIKAEQYRIVAFDSCDNYSDISFAHKSILLKLEQNSCEKTLNLNWSHYSAWPENQRNYELWKSKNGGGYKIEAVFAGNITSCSLTDLENKSDYCFIIRAKNLSKNTTASSNTKCLKTDYLESPEYIYLSNVSVEGGNIELSWTTQLSSDWKEYKIYRGEAMGMLTLYNSLDYTDSNEKYIDGNVDISNKIYYYQISIIDLCGKEVGKSNVSNSILLQLEGNTDGSILSWNPYLSWIGGTKNQYLFVEEEKNWTVEQILDKNANRYVSGLRIEEMKGYEKCFYVEDFENDNNKYGLNESSKSNIVCLTGDLLVHWPNAFSPNSGIDSNRSFKPLGMLINHNESEMIIYDRWGNEVYNMIGILDGWDGMINGNEAQVGTYYYYSSLIGKNNKSEKFKGTFHLIR